MAINMCDKKGLLHQILGEADVNVTAAGITIVSPRLSTPRTIPFDENGKCRSCKSTEVEVNTLITKEGITIWCTRIKNVHFVPFDVVCDLPGHCFFRLKNKARVFNIPYGDSAPSFNKKKTEEAAPPPQQMELTQPQPPQQQQEQTTTATLSGLQGKDEKSMAAAKQLAHLLGSGLLGDAIPKKVISQPVVDTEPVSNNNNNTLNTDISTEKLTLELMDTKQMAEALEEGELKNKAKLIVKLLGSILLADTLGGSPPTKPVETVSTPPPQPSVVQEQQQQQISMETTEALPTAPSEAITTSEPPAVPILAKDDKLLEEFYNSLSAATTFMDTSTSIAEESAAPVADGPHTVQQQIEAMKTTTPENDDDEKMLEDFYESLNAATAGFPPLR